MLRSEWSESRMKSSAGHGAMVAVCRLAICAVMAVLFVSSAVAQGTSEFTLNPQPFNPDAVAPSGVSSSQIVVGLPDPSSPGVSVQLSCQVTGQQGATSPP